MIKNLTLFLELPNTNAMRKLLALLAVLMWISLSTHAQTKTITGRITDQQGQPVPFATVKIKSSRGGTAADADGYFQIKVPAASVLVITGTGITMKEIPVGGQSYLAIQIVRKESELSTV